MMKKYLIPAMALALAVPALAADVSMDSVILIPRTAPGTPTNGQCWTTTAGLYCRINGATVGPYGTGGSSPTIASGTAALGTTAIASGVCATAVVSAGAGVLTTDPIEWGFNGDPTGVSGYTPGTAGMLTIIAYPTANNANFKVCNNTSASVTPGAITLNWRVAR